MPAVLAMGVMAACTPQANHAPDQPHVADAECKKLWQAITNAAQGQTNQGQFLAALETAANQEETLIKFIWKILSFNCILPTRRAVGCTACDAQKL